MLTILSELVSVDSMMTATVPSPLPYSHVTNLSVSESNLFTKT